MDNYRKFYNYFEEAQIDKIKKLKKDASKIAFKNLKHFVFCMTLNNVVFYKQPIISLMADYPNFCMVLANEAGSLANLKFYTYTTELEIPIVPMEVMKGIPHTYDLILLLGAGKFLVGE